jgi:hypothetical protein
MPPKKNAPKSSGPKTPAKGKKRALSEEAEAPKTPAKKQAKHVADAVVRTPQREDGRAYVVPVDPFAMASK